MTEQLRIGVKAVNLASAMSVADPANRHIQGSRRRLAKSATFFSGARSINSLPQIGVSPMPVYTLQDAIEAEQRVKDAQAYNRCAARNSEVAKRQATELRRRSDVARLAAASTSEKASGN